MVKVTSWAPPCATASRAREIRRRSGPDPKPLRTNTHPEGIPSLEGLDAARVESANKLYNVTCQFVLLLGINFNLDKRLQSRGVARWTLLFIFLWNIAWREWSVIVAHRLLLARIPGSFWSLRLNCHVLRTSVWKIVAEVANWIIWRFISDCLREKRPLLIKPGSFIWLEA